MPRPADEILSAISGILKRKPYAIVAIDGRCAAGKTTLAEELCRKIHCNPIHMDDFFLREDQRTAERLAEPGGNVDYERFIEEVLIPLHGGEEFSYRPYDCRTGDFKPPVKVIPAEISVVEGSYSAHPELRKYYDLTVFLTVDPDEQLRRIARRSPEKLSRFKEEWIPLEERYFSAFDIAAGCDMRFG